MIAHVVVAAGSLALLLQSSPDWLSSGKARQSPFKVPVVSPTSVLVDAQPRIVSQVPQVPEIDCGIRVFRAHRNPDPGIAIQIPAGHYTIRTVGGGCQPQFARVAAAEPAGPAQQDVYKVGDAGLTAPRLIKESKPKYTPKAMQDRVQGMVTMSAVVNAEGNIENVQVTQSLHEELDAEAVKTLKLWKFRPGTVDGKPVPVQVDIEMTFTLRDKKD